MKLALQRIGWVTGCFSISYLLMVAALWSMNLWRGYSVDGPLGESPFVGAYMVFLSFLSLAAVFTSVCSFFLIGFAFTKEFKD